MCTFLVQGLIRVSYFDQVVESQMAHGISLPKKAPNFEAGLALLLTPKLGSG